MKQRVEEIEYVLRTFQEILKELIRLFKLKRGSHSLPIKFPHLFTGMCAPWWGILIFGLLVTENSGLNMSVRVSTLGSLRWENSLEMWTSQFMGCNLNSMNWGDPVEHQHHLFLLPDLAPAPSLPESLLQTYHFLKLHLPAFLVRIYFVSATMQLANTEDRRVKSFFKKVLAGKFERLLRTNSSHLLHWWPDRLRGAF